MEQVERGWVPARHIEEIENAVLAGIFGTGPRFIIVVAPPRHGKTTYLGKYLPAKYLDWFPDRWVIFASYAADYARKWGRRTRDLIQYHPEHFRIEVSDEQSAATMWEVGLRGNGRADQPGGMITAGAGGPVGGHGADLFIIDDPVKNWAEADSEAYRENTWDWYTGVARDRLDPGGVMVMAMHRWHDDDVVGRLLKAQANGGDDFTVVHLPAICEDVDLVDGTVDWLGRTVGETLWPERYPPEEIASVMSAQGPYKASAKFQGRPQSGKGHLFNRSDFRYFQCPDPDTFELIEGGEITERVRRSECVCLQFVDTAATEKDLSDYFVCSTWYVTPKGTALLYDVFREQAQTVKHDAIMRSLYDRYHPQVQGVENKTYGLALIQRLANELPIQSMPADVSKFARAVEAQPLYTNHRVYHRIDAPWLGVWEDEITGFPKGTHDDQVDTLSMLALYIYRWNEPLIEVWGEKQ